MTEENDGPAGQRLRWWQDTTTTIPPVGGIAARTYVQHTELDPVLPDIGHELEEEARKRVIALASGERVEIYANAGQNNARLRKRILLVGVPSFAYFGLIALAAHDPVFLIAWLFLAVEFAVIYRVMNRATAKLTRPAVTLTTDGIEIHTLYQDIGLVRWDEIKSIRAYTCIYRYVGIVPTDTKALCRRLSSKAAFLIRTNDVFRPLVAPINLAQQMLPISADHLIKKIEVFRLENRV